MAKEKEYNLLSRVIFGGCLLALLFLPLPSRGEYTRDGELFLEGFNAYQQKDFERAIETLSLLVAKYPSSPLRDTSYLMLAKTELKAGNPAEAASYLSLLFREYPETPRWWVDGDLARLIPERSPVPTATQTTAAKTVRAAAPNSGGKKSPSGTRSTSSKGDSLASHEMVGFATSYGRGFNGRKTASGRPYRPEDLTAAFPKLPLGSKAKVVNLVNQREVVVTVNDRCPSTDVPWITLSQAAVDRLEFGGQRHAKVRIVPLED